MNKTLPWITGITVAAVVVAGYFIVVTVNQKPSAPTPAPVNQNLVSFSDPAQTFTISYPKELTLKQNEIGFVQVWREGTTTPGLLELVVGLPREFAPMTNFGEAALTVGSSKNAQAVSTCTSGIGEYATRQGTVSINGVEFTKFTLSDAGAGNFYDTTSYRTVRNGTCYAVEYTIHSTNIGNYSPDQGIKEFDRVKVQGLFEEAIQTFKFL